MAKTNVEIIDAFDKYVNKNGLKSLSDNNLSIYKNALAGRKEEIRKKIIKNRVHSVLASAGGLASIGASYSFIPAYMQNKYSLVDTIGYTTSLVVLGGLLFLLTGTLLEENDNQKREAYDASQEIVLIDEEAKTRNR